MNSWFVSIRAVEIKLKTFLKETNDYLTADVAQSQFVNVSASPNRLFLPFIKLSSFLLHFSLRPSFVSSLGIHRNELGNNRRACSWMVHEFPYVSLATIELPHLKNKTATTDAKSIRPFIQGISLRYSLGKQTTYILLVEMRNKENERSCWHFPEYDNSNICIVGRFV